MLQRLSNVPAASSAGIRDAIGHIRARNPALIGAILFWAFQIAVLWAAFHAFGDSPPLAVLVFRAFTFWLPLLPGVDAYFRLRRTVDGWKQERAAAAA